jgi:hypothetical protein
MQSRTLLGDVDLFPLKQGIPHGLNAAFTCQLVQGGKDICVKQASG